MQLRSTSVTLEKFLTSGQPKIVAKNEVIYRSDSSQSYIFFIKNGYVKSYTITPTGANMTLSFYGSKSIFPLSPALRDTSRELTFHLRDIIYFEAMTEVEYHRVSLKTFYDYLQSSPSMYREVVQRLIDNYEIYLARIEATQFRHAQQRVAYHLLVIASLFGSVDKKTKQATINIPLTHNELAENLGMARETVTRELDGLKKMGALSTEERLMLIDVTKLESVLEL